jgi:Domain of unknown function (DUF397)
MGDAGVSSQWRKSSFSGQGDCVQWVLLPNTVCVRDSKDPDGPVLTFTHSEWRAFRQGILQGEADPEAFATA